MIRINLRGKEAGMIDEGNTYHTTRMPEHYFKLYGGFGISSVVLQQLLKNDVKEIKIHYHGKSGPRDYRTTVRDFLTKGLTWENGQDKQYILPTMRMEKI